MHANERREEIMSLLQNSDQPMSATAMAGLFHVSRQLIVGDVALLRASGAAISATPRGYIFQRPACGTAKLRTIACRHSPEQMADEIYSVVDHGGALLDVTVEHPVYGQLSGQLQIFSRFDADEFIRKVEENRAIPLSHLTGGIHLHTIQYQSDEDLARVISVLAKKGFLLQE